MRTQEVQMYFQNNQQEHFGTLTWQTPAMDEHSDWLAALQATCAHETCWKHLLYKREHGSTNDKVLYYKFFTKLTHLQLKSWLLYLRNSLRVGYENGLVAFTVGHGLHKWNLGWMVLGFQVFTVTRWHNDVIFIHVTSSWWVSTWRRRGLQEGGDAPRYFCEKVIRGQRFKGKIEMMHGK